MSELKNRVKWLKYNKIIGAVLLILTGILFAVLPESSADLLCTLCGWILIIGGAIAVAVFILCGFFFGGYSLLTGITLLLCGIICLTHPGLVEELLNVIFGCLIIIDGGTSVTDSIDCRRAGVDGWLPLMLLSVFTVILGFIVLFGTFDAVMVFAGIALIAVGICDLIAVFGFSRRIRQAKRTLHHAREEWYADSDLPDDIQ